MMVVQQERTDHGEGWIEGLSSDRRRCDAINLQTVKDAHKRIFVDLKKCLDLPEQVASESAIVPCLVTGPGQINPHHPGHPDKAGLSAKQSIAEPCYVLDIVTPPKKVSCKNQEPMQGIRQWCSGEHLEKIGYIVQPMKRDPSDSMTATQQLLQQNRAKLRVHALAPHLVEVYPASSLVWLERWCILIRIEVAEVELPTR